MFKRENLPAEASIFAVFIGIAVLFEVLGWVFVGKSFLGNPQRLEIIILQVCIFGIIAVGVTQVIITSGIDLSISRRFCPHISTVFRFTHYYSNYHWPVSGCDLRLD